MLGMGREVEERGERGRERKGKGGVGKDFGVLDHSITCVDKATFDFWVDDIKVFGKSKYIQPIFPVPPRPMRHLSSVSCVWKRSVISIHTSYTLRFSYSNSLAPFRTYDLLLFILCKEEIRS